MGTFRKNLCQGAHQSGDAAIKTGFGARGVLVYTKTGFGARGVPM